MCQAWIKMTLSVSTLDRVLFTESWENGLILHGHDRIDGVLKMDLGGGTPITSPVLRQPGPKLELKLKDFSDILEQTQNMCFVIGRASGINSMWWHGIQQL